MGFLDELKRLTHPYEDEMEDDYDEDEDVYEDEDEPEERNQTPPPREREEPRRREYQEPPRRNNGGKVVNIHATTQLQVVLVKPDRYENASEIADHLRDKRTVVLNLEKTQKDVSRRLLDFLSGVAYAQEGYRYVLGSVLNQVLLHQSVIGLETKAAMDKYGIQADIIIGCAGGGSNVGGLISPFVGQMLRGEANYRIIAVEPASCPSLTRGKFAYDFCDTGMVCPLAKMYTLGSGFIPSANHAGGLRYHGMSPVVSQLYHDGLIEATSVEQTKVFEAATYFARVEGILPAPESSHAIRVAIDEALKCKETGEEKTIVFGLTGTGYFDMVAYEKFNNGEMSDYIPTDADLEQGFAGLPKVNEP